MKPLINKILLVCTLACLMPTMLIAQTSAPMWVDVDVRNMQYPQDTYYTGFAEVSVQDLSIESAAKRAQQMAIGELSDRVRVTVSSRQQAIDVSYSGSEIEEQIRSRFISLIETASQIDVVGSKVQTYYDAYKKLYYAFAYVSREELRMYYQNQISLYLNKVEGALMIASNLASQGMKVKARQECLGVVDAFAHIAYSQDLLTAIDPFASDAMLQQIRSERLRSRLVQTLADLENSTYVYIECEEMVNGQSVVHIADRLPGLLTEQGCGCVFTDTSDGADYVIKVSARLERCEDAPNNIVFCYATATLSVLNTHTQKLQKPKIAQAKGGWTNGNYANATEEAFGDLTKQIANQIVPIIKK